MKIVRGPAAAAALFVSGCAYPGPDTQRLYDSMIGRPPADLVRTIGVPTQTINLATSQFLDYAETTSYATYPPGFGWGGGFHRGFGGFGGWDGGYAQYYQDVCRTTFEVQQGRITGWKTHGC